MQKWRVALALSATAVPVVASAERAPEILTRSGKWTLDEGRDSCQLYAQFGKGDAAVVARFARFEPGEAFNLTLLGKPMKASSPVGEAKIDFGLAGAPETSISMNGNLGEWSASFFNGLRLDGWHSDKQGEVGPPITPQQEAAVTGMTVAIKGKPPFRLALGKFAGPLAMLRKCADGLVAGWGYDAQVQARLLRRVTPKNAVVNWLTWQDYPSDAVRGGYSGFVQVRLDVDAGGAIANCHVVERSDQEVFATTVCKVILKRARVMPALDERGQQVRSYMLLKFRFQIG